MAAVGTPNLIFANVFLGHLFRAIPQIHDMWGYFIATIGVPVVVGAVVFRFATTIF
jgi:hypothetical protein